MSFSEIVSFYLHKCSFCNNKYNGVTYMALHLNSEQYTKWKFDSLSFCLETTSQLLLSEGLKKDPKNA